MPRTVYLGPSHFSLLSLSNTKNLCFRKAGAGAAQHLPPNPTQILITRLRVFLKSLSLATGLSDHKSPGWWQRRMWGARPVLVVGTWSRDGRANSCAGWGQQTHMFGQEMSVSFPDREERKENVHRQTGSWTRSERPREPGGFRDTGGTGVLPHRQRAWRAGPPQTHAPARLW